MINQIKKITSTSTASDRDGFTRKLSYSTLEALAITKDLEKSGYVRPRVDSLDLSRDVGDYVPRAHNPLLSKHIEATERKIS